MHAHPRHAHPTQSQIQPCVLSDLVIVNVEGLHIEEASQFANFAKTQGITTELSNVPGSATAAFVRNLMSTLKAAGINVFFTCGGGLAWHGKCM